MPTTANKAKITKRQGKVLAAKLVEPNLSTREIAAEVGIPHRTAAKDLADIAQDCTTLKSQEIIQIAETDKKTLTLLQEEILKRIMNDPNKIHYRDLVLSAKTAYERYAIIMGNATNEEGGLNIVLEN